MADDFMERPFWEAPENELAVRELLNQITSNRGIVPFVGAGISRPYHFPLWTEFLRQKSSDAGLEKEIEDRIRDQQYEQAAEDLEQVLGKTYFNAAIREVYGRPPEIGPFDLTAAQYIPFLSDGPVITTNFDRVIECVYEHSGTRFKEVVWGSRSSLIREAIGEWACYLLKVHGDALATEDRVLTRSEYSKHYGEYSGRNILNIQPDHPLPFLLNRIMSSSSLLFLGCSLVRDRIMDILDSLAKTPHALRHFAVLPAPQTPKERIDARREYLEQYNVWTVWLFTGRQGEGYGQLGPFLDFLVTERLRMRPDHTVTQLKKALQEQSWEEVSALYEKGERRYPVSRPDHIRFTIGIAKEHLRDGDPSNGLPLIDKAIELDDQNPDFHFWQGLSHFALGHWEQASGSLEACLRLDPDDWRALLTKGLILLLDNEYLEALEPFTAILHTRPHHTEALYFRSLAYIGLQDFDRACQDMELLERSEDSKSLQFASLMKEARDGKMLKKMAVVALKGTITGGIQLFPKTWVQMDTAGFFESGQDTGELPEGPLKRS